MIFKFLLKFNFEDAKNKKETYYLILFKFQLRNTDQARGSSFVPNLLAGSLHSALPSDRSNNRIDHVTSAVRQDES